MNYNKLTNKQISLSVANAMPVSNKERSNLVQMVTDNELCYCRDWSATGCIIEKNKINIKWCGGVEDLWSARNIHTRIALDKEPLRAACIVFLMMIEDLEGYRSLSDNGDL